MPICGVVSICGLSGCHTAVISWDKKTDPKGVSLLSFAVLFLHVLKHRKGLCPTVGLPAERKRPNKINCRGPLVGIGVTVKMLLKNRSKGCKRNGVGVATGIRCPSFWIKMSASSENN